MDRSQGRLEMLVKIYEKGAATLRAMLAKRFGSFGERAPSSVLSG